MTTLAKAAEANPAIREILDSDSPHTVAAQRISALNGFRTTESSVRRWRMSRDWAPARQAAVARVIREPGVTANLADQGLQLYDALKPRNLPEDPVTLLGNLLKPYAGPGQRDLRVVRKTDADGITTVTVTAIRDDAAEAAACIMADRIVRGEEHRCLAYRDDSRDRVIVFTNPKSRAPLFPLDTPLLRYRRYADALVRKLAEAGWCLTAQPDYNLVFTKQAPGGNALDSLERELLERISDPEQRQAMQELRKAQHHETRLRFEGL